MWLLLRTDLKATRKLTTLHRLQWFSFCICVDLMNLIVLKKKKM